MRLRFVAIASLLLTVHLTAATRPHYGGAVDVQVHSTILQFSPGGNEAVGNSSSVSLRSQLLPLAFDSLLVIDSRGNLAPNLALRWDHSLDYKRWMFWLRHGVKLHDGSALTLADVASSLQLAHPEWRTRVLGEAVVVESDDPMPGLPYQLAMPENAIAIQRSDTWLGTGPFRIESFQPQHQLTLTAFADCWSGRPYLDQISIHMAQTGAPQGSLADIIDSGDLRPVIRPSAHEEISQPIDLIALVNTGADNALDARLLDAVSLALDRKTLATVLLQRRAEPAYALLPQWMSGYEQVFAGAPDIAKAHELVAEIAPKDSLPLGYDDSDPVLRIIAQRIALDVREAGLNLRLVQAPPDGNAGQPNGPALLLKRLPLLSNAPIVALIDLSGKIGGAMPSFPEGSGSERSWFEFEQATLAKSRLLPVVHLSRVTVVSTKIRGWCSAPAPTWCLQDVWIDKEPGRGGTP